MAFELRRYKTGQIGWVGYPATAGSNMRLVIHLKSADDPLANLVIDNAKDAQALRDLAGDYLLHLASEGLME